MKGNLKFILASILIVLVGFGVHLLSSSGGDEEINGKTSRQMMRRPATLKKMRPRKGRRGGRLAANERSEKSLSDNEGAVKKRERPVFDDIEDSDLSELQRSVLRQLREAFDNDSIEGVRKAIAKFNAPKSKGGLGGDVPKVIRSHAVSALGWFGSAGLADMVEFMADVDPDIEEEAFAQFELILDNWDLSDHDRSSALISLLKAIHDPDRIDPLLMALNNMRNSVKGETIIGILSSGTSEAKAVMQEQIEFFTDFDITDAAGVSTWMKNNPDNEGDEEFYGGEKK